MLLGCWPGRGSRVCLPEFEPVIQRAFPDAVADLRGGVALCCYRTAGAPDIDGAIKALNNRPRCIPRRDEGLDGA